MILKVTIPEICRRLGKANTIKGVGGPDGKVTITISGRFFPSAIYFLSETRRRLAAGYLVFQFRVSFMASNPCVF